MKLRRYAVTVMDNWTPTREFWTFARAKRWQDAHNFDSSRPAHLFRWGGVGWCEIDGNGEHLWTDAYSIPRVGERPGEPDYEVTYCRGCGAAKHAWTDSAGTEVRYSAPA